MVIVRCPRCQERVVTSPFSEDIIHQCHGDDVLAQEDVPVVGQWEDYTGSGDAPAQQAMFQGLANNIAGTDAAVLGGKVWTPTIRGKRAATHRQRQYLEYIEHPPRY